MKKIILFLLFATPVYAQGGQATVNPTMVEFVASADHNTTILGGADPMLTRYELRIYLENAAQPVSAYDLGKPAPDANNKIIVQNPAWFLPLSMNVRHVARVFSIGPGGENASDASNPFGHVGPAAKATNLVVR